VKDGFGETRMARNEKSTGHLMQEAGAMEHDFVYCPRCKRYSIFHWVCRVGQWECEDCTYKPPKVEEVECVTTGTLPS